jgi:hypothetical protein
MKKPFLDNEKKRVLEELTQIKDEVVHEFNKYVGQCDLTAVITHRKQLENKIYDQFLNGIQFKNCTIL